MLTCLVLQGLFLVQNSVAAVVSDGRQFDLFSGVILAAIVLLFHVAFIIVVAVKVVRHMFLFFVIATVGIVFRAFMLKPLF